MSLRGRLLLLLGLSWLLLGGGMTLWMYERASSQMDSALDSRLAASAGMVGRLLSQLPLPEAAPAQGGAAPLDVLARDGVACEVSEWRAEVLARTVARTPGSPRLRSADNGFGYLEQKGVVWRTYVLEQGDLRIATADRMDLRDGLRREVALAAILPFGVCLLAGLLLLWLGIGRGLAPLERLRRALTARCRWSGSICRARRCRASCALLRRPSPACCGACARPCRASGASPTTPRTRCARP